MGVCPRIKDGLLGSIINSIDNVVNTQADAGKFIQAFNLRLKGDLMMKN
jgi:hypothetical protein